MAFDLDSITHGRRKAAPRIFLIGTHGIGKTTWACSAPDPIVIQTEDGLGLLETPAFPLATSVADVFEALNTLYHQDHGFKTVVLDSADWLDNLISKEIYTVYEKNDLAYGKSALLIAEQWQLILDWLNTLRRKGMTVILIGHVEIKRYDPPDGDSYERYQPKMGARPSALIQEWADCVLFANFKTLVKKEVVGNETAKKPMTKSKPLAIAERLLYTGEKPAHFAKNRFGLPAELPLEWSAFESAMAQATA